MSREQTLRVANADIHLDLTNQEALEVICAIIPHQNVLGFHSLSCQLLEGVLKRLPSRKALQEALRQAERDAAFRAMPKKVVGGYHGGAGA